MIRNVQLSDAKRIAEIYNPYIKDTVITFEEEPVTEQEIAERIKYIISKSFPYIVYEENGDVVGYAYLSNWRSRSAYDITLETSVYIDEKAQAKGLGSILYAELINKAREINIHSLIGVISLPNPISQKLHKKFDFELVGNFKESGLKFNKFIDVEFWQLIL